MFPMQIKLFHLVIFSLITNCTLLSRICAAIIYVYIYYMQSKFSESILKSNRIPIKVQCSVKYTMTFPRKPQKCYSKLNYFMKISKTCHLIYNSKLRKPLKNNFFFTKQKLNVQTFQKEIIYILFRLGTIFFFTLYRRIEILIIH
jgi:hypothetical protein